MTREQILKEFKGVEGINEAKKIYKTLAKNYTLIWKMEVKTHLKF